ncbi:MAG: hypothetical protein JWM12_2093, partial [Ilumatobacteraceae bacterium]|nr:hypothetical protein [Ilumatobacteraceae bacterium]
MLVELVAAGHRDRVALRRAHDQRIIRGAANGAAGADEHRTGDQHVIVGHHVDERRREHDIEQRGHDDVHGRREHRGGQARAAVDH